MWAPGLLALLAATADAPPLEERVRVTVRLVDFAVVDKQGRPVTDLRREEVELWDDGVRQEILDFLPAHRRFVEGAAESRTTLEPEAAAGPGEAAGAAGTAPAAPERPAPRWIVLLFDARNLSYQSRARCAAAALELIEHDVTKEDRVALLVDDDELRVVVPFSTDHALTARYLKEPDGLSSRYRDIENLLEELRDTAEDCRTARDRDGCARVAGNNFLNQTSRESETSLEHLEALLRGLAAIPDRKILFYFSEGFLQDPGDVAAAGVQHAIGQIGYNVNATTTFLMRDFSHRLDPIYQIATRARVGFYPVNTMRKMTDDLFSPERQTEGGPENLPQARTDPFEATWQQVRKMHDQLAHATGGVPLFRRDPAGLLGEQLRSSAGVYTVSYEPKELSFDRRKIKLKVARTKVEVLYRSRYNFVADAPRPLEGELQVDATPVPAGGGLVHAELKVYGTAFEDAPDSKPRVSVASVFFELRDAKHVPVRDLYEVIAFPRDDKAAQFLRRPFALRLPPGQYTLRADVSDVNGPGRGSFFRTFTVEAEPAPSAGGQGAGGAR